MLLAASFDTIGEPSRVSGRLMMCDAYSTGPLRATP